MSSEPTKTEAAPTRIGRGMLIVVSSPSGGGKGTLIDAAMVDALEQLIDEHASRFTMPAEFIIPGENPGSAAIDLARAIVRRTERRCVALARDKMLPDGEILRYLNRLADLLFVLARYDEGGGASAR